MEKLNNEIEYLKTTPSHSRDRLRRKTKPLEDEIKFIKQVPVRPRDSCTLARKSEKVEITKEKIQHPRERKKLKEKNGTRKFGCYISKF